MNAPGFPGDSKRIFFQVVLSVTTTIVKCNCRLMLLYATAVKICDENVVPTISLSYLRNPKRLKKA